MDELETSGFFIPGLFKPPSLLPIARHRNSLLYVVENFQVTIVVGQTGSGKTTQIPQFLYRAGWCDDGKLIAVTQVCRLPSIYI
jgi:ATP-dependent RNA helicase DDX35